MQKCRFEFDKRYGNHYRIHFSNNHFINRILGVRLTCFDCKSMNGAPVLSSDINIYLLHLETFPTTHLFLPPGATKAEGPLGLASMQLPVFSWISVPTELSEFPPVSANVNNTVKARANRNYVITNVISANNHFASTFSMQIFKFQRRSCLPACRLPACRDVCTQATQLQALLPFPALPPERPGELARTLRQPWHCPWSYLMNIL